MSDDTDDLKQTDPRLAEQPVRSYELPGGPYAKSLGQINVAIQAPFKRGSEQDHGAGSRRNTNG